MQLPPVRPLLRLVGAGVLAAGLALALVPAATAAPARPGRHHRHACRDLSVSLGAPQGAAGSSYWNIRFRNVGTRRCTLSGFPRVVYTDAAGHRTGTPAGHQLGARTVHLAPGAVAVAALQVPDAGNFPVRRCRATDVTGLRITVSGRHHRVAFASRVCTTRAGRAYLMPYRRVHHSHR